MSVCGAEKSPFSAQINYRENCNQESPRQAYYRFNKDQFYEGEFFRDGFHGHGTYKWEDESIYEGQFYSNYKEGYAVLSFPDNTVFEGLFIRNRPFGPGIMTHENGRQDVGFWMGCKLVRLSRVVDFVIPRLATTSSGKIKLLQFRRLIPMEETDWNLNSEILKKCGYPFEYFYSPYSSLIYDPRSTFFDAQAFEKAYFVNMKDILRGFAKEQPSWETMIKFGEERGENLFESEKSDIIIDNHVPSHCLCSENVFEMKYKTQDEVDICDRSETEGEYEMGILTNLTKFGTIEPFKETKQNELDNVSEISKQDESFSGLKEEEENKEQSSSVVSWNSSDLCVEFLKQIFRYRAFEDKLNFNLRKLMLGVRTAFRKTGINETHCLHFLKMCSIGPASVVSELLSIYEISEELMDGRGNNSLMFAAAADEHEVMDVLLDHGVNVDCFNDENLTPLSLCLLRRLAYTNGISNWEKAFLPNEIYAPAGNCLQELEGQVSIPSLDRIFGDGISLYDRISGFDNFNQTHSSHKASSDNSEINQAANSRYSFQSADLSDLTEITIFNFSKSSKIQDTNHEDEHSKHNFISRAIISGAEAREKDENEMHKVNVMISKCSKRNEYLTSIEKPMHDKYLFEFTFEKIHKMEESQKDDNTRKPNKKGSKTVKEEILSAGVQVEETKEEENPTLQMSDNELSKKINEIDKTILKLLSRGADPNLSEVPKPVIHLGVYTKDIDMVYNLLLYGANPNNQLYPNEGLLTPLHIIVLQPPAKVEVEICELLLKFGADPNKQTHPGFSISEEEKVFLDPLQGRTPLQLLCMRPDLEICDADLKEYLIQIALLLVEDTDKKCLYNGHSDLTLAMLFGNINLLKALLQSQLYDPNEVLGNDRGTALHVLLSTELQKNISYDKSINMCELLLGAGANPFKKFKEPESLRGNCIDYGYRELEARKADEKEAKKTEPEKKGVKKPGKVRKLAKEESLVAVHLRNHERVIEYLGKRSFELIRKKGGFRKRNFSIQDTSVNWKALLDGLGSNLEFHFGKKNSWEKEDVSRKKDSVGNQDVPEKDDKSIKRDDSIREPSLGKRFHFGKDDLEMEDDSETMGDVKGKKGAGVDKRKKAKEKTIEDDSEEDKETKEKKIQDESKAGKKAKGKAMQDDSKMGKKAKEKTEDDSEEDKETKEKKIQDESKDGKKAKGKTIQYDSKTGKKAKMTEEDDSEEDKDAKEKTIRDESKTGKKAKGKALQDETKAGKKARMTEEDDFEERKKTKEKTKKDDSKAGKKARMTEEDDSEEDKEAKEKTIRDESKAGKKAKGKALQDETKAGKKARMTEEDDFEERKKTKEKTIKDDSKAGKKARMTEEDDFEERKKTKEKTIKDDSKAGKKARMTEEDDFEERKKTKKTLKDDSKAAKKAKEMIQDDSKTGKKAKMTIQSDSKADKEENRSATDSEGKKREVIFEGKGRGEKKKYVSVAFFKSRRMSKISSGKVKKKTVESESKGRKLNINAANQRQQQADTQQLGASSRTFPEKHRKSLLQLCGNCVNIDVNELLLPYVVLRDGELYYRFHGNPSTIKEQYSLI